MDKNTNLSDKKYLYWNLKHYCQKNNVDLDTLIPKTFNVRNTRNTDQEYTEFKQYFLEKSKLKTKKHGEKSPKLKQVNNK